MGARTEKLRQWYSELPRTKKILYATLAVIALLVIIQSAATGWLWFQSIQHGLTIYVQPQPEHLSLAHGQTATLEYELGVSNAPLCSAQCEWTITDHRTGERLQNGTETFRNRIPTTITQEITAPPNGRYTAPIQFVASCTNTPSTYCQLTDNRSVASATTATQVTFTPQRQTLYEELQTQAPAHNQNTSQALQALTGISAHNDTRAQATAQRAATQAQQLKDHLAQAHTAAQQDALEELQRLLAAPPATDAIQEYRALVRQEQEAASTYQELLAKQATLSAVASIANQTDAQRLAQQAAAAREAQQRFSEQPITTSHHAITLLANTTQQLQHTYNATATARQAHQLLHEEQTAACTLKNTSCPQQTNTTTDYAQAVKQLRAACEELIDLPAAFTQAHRSYAQQLAPNQSVNETEAQHNISELRAQQNWSAREQQLLAQARNQTLNATTRERLATRLAPSNQTTAFTNQHCPVPQRNLTLPAPTPQATLPAQPTTDVQASPITFAQPVCCDANGCGSCTDKKAVLFVHGHSFAQKTAPEYSLQAFDKLALALQERDVYYAGRVFPQRETTSSYQDLRAPLSFTTTYYYDSYPEEGEVLFVSRKTEGIETYAIRLSEAIQAVKQKSGAENITLITHSMGGLVARSYLQIFGAADIDGLVMIATPNNGVSARAQRLCPLIGGSTECADMREDSLFLRKLPRSVPVRALTITGTGCDGRAFDGVVDASSTQLPGVPNINVTGSCPSIDELLHNTLLEPRKHPRTLEAIEEFLRADDTNLGR